MKRAPLVILCLLLLLALFLRTWRLAEECAWQDEIFTLECLDRPFQEAISGMLSTSSSIPPTYPVMAWGWSRLFGTEPEVLRWMSILLGLATLVVLYGTAHRWYGSAGGWMALATLGMSEFHIYYSQEIRVYVVLILVVALTFHCFVRWLEKRETLWYRLHLLCSCLAIATHPFALVYFTVEGAFLLLTGRWRERAFLHWLATFLPVLAILLYWMKQGEMWADTNTYWWIPPVTWDRFVQVYRQLCAHFFFYLGLGAVGWWVLWQRKERDATMHGLSSGEKHLLGSLLWLLPGVLLAVVSLLWKNILLERYFAYAILGAGLLTASSIRLLPGPWKIAALLLAVGLPIAHHARLERPLRRNICHLVEAMGPLDVSHHCVLVNFYRYDYSFEIEHYFPTQRTLFYYANSLDEGWSRMEGQSRRPIIQTLHLILMDAGPEVVDRCEQSLPLAGYEIAARENIAGRLPMVYWRLKPPRSVRDD